MADVSAIQEELEEVTGVAQKAREGEAKYRARLVRAAMSGKNKLSEEDFEELSEEAQEWLNEGVRALKAKETVAEFPEEGDEDDDEEEEEGDEDDDEEEEEGDEDEEEEEGDDDEEEEPAPPKAKAKGKGKGKASEKGGTRTRTGATNDFRRLIVENPEAKLEDLLELAETQGLELAESSAKTLVYHTQATLKILREMDVDLPSGPKRKSRKKK